VTRGTQLAKFQAPGEGRAVFLEWSGCDAEQDAVQGSAGWRKLEEEKKEIRNPPNLEGWRRGWEWYRQGGTPVTGSEKGAFQMARD